MLQHKDGRIVFVIPYLKHAAGFTEDQKKFAMLAHNYHSTTKLMYFLPVRVSYGENGLFKAFPCASGDSGDYAALAQADGFIELKANTKVFPKGYPATFFPWSLQ